MKTNSIRIMAILSALTMLMTSCDGDGGYVVLPMWAVIIIVICFCH